MATPILFLCSTPEELDAHQAIAYDVARELGFSPHLRDPAARLGRDAVAAVERQLAAADLVLAIVGWRRGLVPPPLLGGDGLSPWLHFELRAAFRAGKKVVALLADESFAPDGEPGRRETEARARAVVADLRGELAGIATLFGGDGGGDRGGDRLEAFEAILRQRLEAAREASTPQRTLGGVTAGLRKWPSPPLPEQPYPLLLPYHHPSLLAGRDAQLDQLIQLLDSPVAITGLHAPSGTGKSSLLAAGLVPRLRAAGRAVAFDRHPAEPGLVGRLVADLLDFGEGPRRDDPQLFRLHLSLAAVLGSGPPILVIDQVEDLFQPAARPLRARLGLALATSMQRQSSLEGPPQRWLLAYRREFHGLVVRWLEDVLAEARAEGLAGTADLPHDLARGERFQEWALDPLGAPAPGSRDPLGEATAIFAEAIEKALALRREDGSPRYPYVFAGDGARRLAAAFAASRLAEPRAPLAPELQVVLAHLLESAKPAAGAKPAGGRLHDRGPRGPRAAGGPGARGPSPAGARSGFSRPCAGKPGWAAPRRCSPCASWPTPWAAESRAFPATSWPGRSAKAATEVLERLATSDRLVILQEHQGGRYVFGPRPPGRGAGAAHRRARRRPRLRPRADRPAAGGHPRVGPLRSGRAVGRPCPTSSSGRSPPTPPPCVDSGAGEMVAFLREPGRPRAAPAPLAALLAAAVLVLVAGVAIYQSQRRSEHLARLDRIEPRRPTGARRAARAGRRRRADRQAGLAALLRAELPPDVVERGLAAWPAGAAGRACARRGRAAGAGGRPRRSPLDRQPGLAARLLGDARSRPPAAGGGAARRADGAAAPAPPAARRRHFPPLPPSRAAASAWAPARAKGATLPTSATSGRATWSPSRPSRCSTTR